MILIGTGSEVQYAVAAQEQLAAEGIAARVVSMPCREWFDEQDQAYRDSVIPPDVKARVSVEAGVSLGWRDLVGDAGRIISINHYGASAAGAKLFEEFGFTRRHAWSPPPRRASKPPRSPNRRPDPPRRRRTQGPGRPRGRPRRHHQLSPTSCSPTPSTSRRTHHE